MPIPQRKNIRLPGYDYSDEGAYFVTIVTKDRKPLFGSVENGEMVLNEFGRIVDFTWHDLVNHNPDIGLDEFVIMANHVHGIIVIFPPKTGPNVGAGSREFCAPERSLREEKPAPHPRAGCEPAPTDGLEHAPTDGLEPTPSKKTPLSEIVRQFKTFSARRINQIRCTPGVPVWQRNYFEHIVGTDTEFEQIAEYIANNPIYWLTDTENQ